MLKKLMLVLFMACGAFSSYPSLGLDNVPADAVLAERERDPACDMWTAGQSGYNGIIRGCSKEEAMLNAFASMQETNSLVCKDGSPDYWGCIPKISDAGGHWNVEANRCLWYNNSKTVCINWQWQVVHSHPLYQVPNPYICPPKLRPDYTIGPVEKADGSKWCTRPDIYVACPPEQPNLSLSAGCYGTEQAPVKACSDGNPIIIADGRKIQPEPADLNLANGLFELQRTYTTNTEQDNSGYFPPVPSEQAPPEWLRYKVPAGYRVGGGYISDPYSGDISGVRLKGAWSLNALPRLNIGSTLLTRINGNQRATFKPAGDGSYISREFRGDKVQPAEGGWRYQPEPGVVEQYDASGLLVRRQQQGRTLTISYNARQQPERLTAGDEQLLLSYDDARRLSRAELDSEWVSYGYDERNRLVSVTRNDGRVRQYHYEDPRFPEALTGITDERGVRYASFQYDAQGRAIESRHGEQDRYQFVFGDNQTTVINPLGKETIYRYTNLSGIKRLTSVEGVPSENCAGANKAYSYYPNGQLQTHTDWQGVVTRFEYNSRGLVSREIEAEGTPLQRETRYEYHPVHPWPLRITSDLNITEYDYDDHGNLRASRVLPR